MMRLKFAANLSLLFTDAPFLERFDKAAASGFKAVEFHFPYDFDVGDIRSRLTDNGLKLVLFNLHAGDLDANEWGTLSNPSRSDYFRWSLESALEIAEELDCNQINTMFGNKVPGLTSEEQISCAIKNLTYAAPIAEQSGVTLLVEALNPINFPDFVLHRPSTSIEIVKTVDRSNVKVLYDIYHAQMIEGNLITSIEDNFHFINHIQIADVPGRHEPGTGEINYPGIFSSLNEVGYQGYIGLEYHPSGNTDSSLHWFFDQIRGNHEGS
jgi:hydroxypyruvate isomerase